MSGLNVLLGIAGIGKKIRGTASLTKTKEAI
jgi:hypothetical protein